MNGPVSNNTAATKLPQPTQQGEAPKTAPLPKTLYHLSLNKTPTIHCDGGTQRTMAFLHGIEEKLVRNDLRAVNGSDLKKFVCKEFLLAHPHFRKITDHVIEDVLVYLHLAHFNSQALAIVPGFFCCTLDLHPYIIHAEYFLRRVDNPAESAWFTMMITSNRPSNPVPRSIDAPNKRTRTEDDGIQEV